MYLCIVLLPLVGSLCTGIFGRFLGYRGAAVFTTCFVFFAFLFSCSAFYEVALCASPCYIKLAPWFISEMFDAYWGFLFDSLTVVMCVVVTLVSTLVHMYGISYMEKDPHIPRFMCYLSIFTFFMLMLVTADNYIEMFLGWEGVGLASYLLINFWYTRLQANKAAIKAMLINRVGDFGLALGIMGIYYIFKTVDFSVVFACAAHFAANPAPFVFCNIEFSTLNTICILLFIGAVGKSAQLGLHAWLPDAMEGPTPVSALIHAATMVCSGVFLIARCSPLFEHAPTAGIIVTLVGAMTCLFAATTGLVQNDLKRVIAYSTCSQLGYMVLACGLSNYSVGIFHLMNHAFFKALLFLSAGSVIHALSDEQDMRKMGGLARLIPFTYCMMCIGSLSLVGFPFLTGFYSKEVILECAAANYTVSGNFAYWCGATCVLFTSYYSFRCIFLTFSCKVQSAKRLFKNAHEAPLLMALPLLALAFGSIFVGYLSKDMMIGCGTNFWGNSLFSLPQNVVLYESEYLPQIQKFLPIVFTTLGAVLAFIITKRGTRIAVNINDDILSEPYTLAKSMRAGPTDPIHRFDKAAAAFFLIRKLYFFFNKRWFFDKVYNDLIAQKVISFGYQISFKTIDKGLLEILGPLGVSKTILTFVQQISRLHSGFIFNYAFIMLLGIAILVFLVFFLPMFDPIIDIRIVFVLIISALVASPGQVTS